MNGARSRRITGWLIAGLCWLVPVAVRSAEPDRAAWFRDAKFGLFVHWGLYSIPAGEWQGRKYPVIGEWLMNVAKIPNREYSQLASRFNPTAFDAEAWAQFAQDAGFKYLILTAKHHEGFALFSSKVSAFNVVDATPFKRDIAAELEAACARHHLKLGFYYSQSQDWHEPNAMGNTWDFGPESGRDYDAYLQTKAEPQVRELLEQYHPAVIWFDTPRQMDERRSRRFVDLVRTTSPATLLNSRLTYGGETTFENRRGDFDFICTNDNTIPHQAYRFPWETCITTNHTWGYKAADLDFKSPGEIVFDLVDTASKGGNMLLNIGPDATGRFPAEAVRSLRWVGQWLQANAEAIYGTTGTPFGQELGDFAVHNQDAKGGSVFLEDRVWRCTQRPGKLYLTVFKPGLEFVDLPRIGPKILRAHVLPQPAVGQKARDLPVSQVAGKTRITLGWNAYYYPMALVICVEYAGDHV